MMYADSWTLLDFLFCMYLNEKLPSDAVELGTYSNYVWSELLSSRSSFQRGRGSGHFRTLIQKCLHSPIPRPIQAVNAVHPICIKSQYENNNILGVDTSELRFGSVQNLVLELETRPRTEPFRIHVIISATYRTSIWCMTKMVLNQCVKKTYSFYQWTTVSCCQQ